MSETPLWEQPGWLFERYWIDALSMSAMAEEAGCSEHRIRGAMDTHGIDRRPVGGMPKFIPYDPAHYGQVAEERPDADPDADRHEGSVE